MFKLIVLDQGGVLFTYRPEQTISELILSNPKITDSELKNRIGSYGISEEMLRLLWDINNASIKLAYLSNGSAKGLNELSRHNIIPIFVGGIASQDVNVLKPDLQIYEIFKYKVLDFLGVHIEDSIFIDDQQSNLIPYKSLGGSVYQFKTDSDLRSMLSL
jgi:FMN phosphatase YigB (HAD superfamily)